MKRDIRLLEENGYNVAHREFSGGHNYTCWGNEVGIALEEMFGK